MLRVGRQACLWGHPPPSPPSPGRGIPQPPPPPDWGWWEMLHPTTEGRCCLATAGQYYSRYAGGLFGTVNSLSLSSLSQSHSLSQDFSQSFAFTLGISQGWAVDPSEVVLRPTLSGPRHVKGRAESPPTGL